MKRCPECNSVFPAGHFCDIDGSPLVDARLDSAAALIDRTEQRVDKVSPTAAREAAGQAVESWKPAAIVAIAAVAISLGIFLVYYAMTRRDSHERSSESSSNSSAMQQVGPLLPSRPSLLSGASPTPEPSASPSATPSASPRADAARVELSSSPISTGGDGKDKRGPVIIRLTDGASIEAETAWETNEGIWYRRSGIVTLLNPKQVKAIEQVTSATPEPSPLATSTP